MARYQGTPDDLRAVAIDATAARIVDAVNRGTREQRYAVNEAWPPN
jgi:hypothetical protein